ncbi:hypothetical protein LRY29_01270 [Candidatus Saccharibacteria bacterium]|nr:hypothetical protein [Candidatus Saccharibacteria bacterium]
MHPTNRSQLERAFSSSTQALLISGPAGVGLSTIVERFAAQGDSEVRMVLPEKDEKVDLDKGVISVGQIRALYELVRTTPVGGRTIYIDYAERMGVPAQNDFSETSRGTARRYQVHIGDPCSRYTSSYNSLSNAAGACAEGDS